MPGHVHETEPHAGFFQKRKTQIDGDSAAFFLSKPIWVCSRQRFHKRRFAVINMPGGSHDHTFHGMVTLKGITHEG